MNEPLQHFYSRLSEEAFRLREDERYQNYFYRFEGQGQRRDEVHTFVFGELHGAPGRYFCVFFYPAGNPPFQILAEKGTGTAANLDEVVGALKEQYPT